MSDDPRNPSLEDAILDDPLDAALFGVLADWLEGQSDPRAELIRLQSEVRTFQPKAVRTLLAAHRHYLLGAMAAFADDLRWLRGYLCVATIRDPANVAVMLDHPSSRFLLQLQVIDVGPATVATIAGRAPRSLRNLMLAHRDPGVIAIAELARVATRLTELHLDGAFDTAGLELPNVVELALWGHPGAARGLAKTEMPRLRNLSLSIMPGSTAVELIARGDLDLRELTLRGTAGEGLIDALCRGPLAARLKVLDLHQLSIDEHDLELLAAALPAFLELVDLRLGRISDATYELFERGGVEVSADCYDPTYE